MNARMILLGVLLVLSAKSFSTPAGTNSKVNSPQAIDSVVKAVEVATRDFGTRLHKERDVSWEWGAYVSDIHNYAVGAVDAKDSYIVVFILRQPSVKIYGGGAQYRIGKATGALQFRGFE